MRLGTFVPKSSPDQPRVGALLGDRVLDLGMGSLTMTAFLSLSETGLGRARTLLDEAQGGKHGEALRPLGDVRLLPPVSDASKFLCVGKNYRSHLAELERTDLIRERPQEPTGFIKLNSCLVGQDAEVERQIGRAHV